MFLSLSFVSIKQFQDVFLSNLRAATIKAVTIDDQRNQYTWTRSVVRNVPDIGDLLSRHPAILRGPAVSEHAARVSTAPVLAKVRLAWK